MANGKNGAFDALMADVEKIAADKAANKEAKKEPAQQAKPAAEKKETLTVETRKDVKTFFFPPEIVKPAKDGNVKGFTLSGYEHMGIDTKVFIPMKDEKVEAKQLKYSNKMPNWLVITAENGTAFKTFQAVEDKKAANGERFVEGPAVGMAVLDKLQKEYSNFQEKAQAEKPAQEETAQKDATEVKQDAAEKPKDNGDKPIWIRREAVVSLKDGKGWFVRWFENGGKGDLAAFVPKRGEHFSARQLKDYLMVTADKEARFDLYQQKGKGEASYEKTGNWIGRDTMRNMSYRIKREVEQEQNKLKSAAKGREESAQLGK